MSPQHGHMEHLHFHRAATMVESVQDVKVKATSVWLDKRVRLRNGDVLIIPLYFLDEFLHIATM